jgi:cytochrome c551/c552
MKTIIIILAATSVINFAEARNINLQPVCCPCTQYDCRTAKQSCSQIALALTIMSNDLLNLSSKIRRAELNESCSQPNGGYILEPSALVNVDTELH